MLELNRIGEKKEKKEGKEGGKKKKEKSFKWRCKI